MAQTISIPGLASSDLTPGVLVNMVYGTGAVTGDSSIKTLCLIGMKLSTGTATVGTVAYGPTSTTPLNNSEDAKALFGEGSELFLGYQAAARNNQGTNPIYAIACDELTAGTAATGTITFTTNATANASVRVYVMNQFVDVAINTGDSVTVIAAAVTSEINRLKTIVTATANAGVITLTHRHKGLSGNQVKYLCRIIGSPATTVTPATSTACTGGLGSVDLTNALVTLASNKFSVIVSADGYGSTSGTTGFAALNTLMTSNASALNDNRARLIVGYVDTYANFAGFTATLNNERTEVICGLAVNDTAFILACKAAGGFLVGESSSIPRCNYNWFGTGNDRALWNVEVPYSGVKPTRAQLLGVMNSGGSAVKVEDSQTYILKRCTSRYLNGAVTDYRIREPHKVVVCDQFVLDLQAILGALMVGKMIAADPPAGTMPLIGTVTPKIIKSNVINLLTQYRDNVLLENIDTTIATLVIQRSTVATSRFEMRIGLDVADILDQVCIEASQLA